MTTISGAHSQSSYAAADKLIAAMNTRTFNPDVFALALVESAGPVSEVIVRTFLLYVANLAEKAKHVDMSAIDNDTMEAFDQALRIQEVLTAARQAGTL